MALKEDIEKEVDSVISTAWADRDGRDVPAADDVALGNGAVKIRAAMLYADLAESTRIAMTLPPWMAAEIAKAFLATSCRIIRYHGGHIRSFDGDRVMGVFVGDDMCVRAAKAAMQIYWAVVYVLRPKFGNYPTFKASGLTISHGVGIDVGDVFVARTGIRRNNDLVWVGRAPNVAAKLASVRDRSYATYITHAAFAELNADTYWKNSGDPSARELMWESWTWPEIPSGMQKEIYRSRWTWRPPSGV